jgi:hypothetical protein
MRRRDVIGLALYVPGFVPAYAAFLALGNRVFPTATAARNNGMDHAEVYFLGVEGNSVADLGLVLGWMMIGLVGIALIAAGYRLITTTPAGVRRASHGVRSLPWVGIQV